MASYDELDDETLLKLIQRRQEESALQDRALNERSQLGGIIAGIAGGLESGMRGQSGSQGAQRGMEFVDTIRRRSQALQQAQDTADITPLLKIAQMRAEKNKRREAQQDMMERLKAQSEFQIARDERLEPMKTAREMSRLAYMSGDKRMQLQAQKELQQAQLGETGRRFDVTEQRRGSEFEAEQARRAAEAAQKQAQFDAEMKRKQDELDAVTKRLFALEDKRQGGATERTGITAAAKAAPKPAKGAAPGKSGPTVTGYEIIEGSMPTDQDAKEVKKISSGINGANRAIDKLRTAVKSGSGVRALPGSAERAQLDSLVKSLVIDMKEAANLGALAGPDLDLVMGMIGDPTGIRAAYMGNDEYLKVLDQAQATLNEKHGDRVKAYGYYPLKGTLPSPSGVSSDQAVLRDIEKRAGLAGGTKMINGVPYRKVQGGWQRVK